MKKIFNYDELKDEKSTIRKDELKRQIIEETIYSYEKNQRSMMIDINTTADIIIETYHEELDFLKSVVEELNNYLDENESICEQEKRDILILIQESKRYYGELLCKCSEVFLKKISDFYLQFPEYHFENSF